MLLPLTSHASLAKLRSHLFGRMGFSVLFFLRGYPAWLVLLAHMPTHEYEYEHLLQWVVSDGPLSKEALENHVRDPILTLFPVTCAIALGAIYGFHYVAGIVRDPKSATGMSILAVFTILVSWISLTNNPWTAAWNIWADGLRFDMDAMHYPFVATVLWKVLGLLFPGLFKPGPPNLAVGVQHFYNRILNIRKRGHRELSLPRFKYRPLQNGEIRLLRLSRWYPLTHIKVKVEHVSLDTKPSYEAISYTWGDKSLPEQDITINGCSLSIPHGAYEVIVGRASFFRTRTLWIDAVCINQTDDSEKCRQIPMMRDIYRLASRVVVWLGHSPSCSDAILAVMSLFYTAQKYNGADLFRHYSDLGSRQHWLGLIDLLNHQWFHRSWIIQEVTVPSEIHIVYGGHYISWDVLLSVITLFFEIDMASLLLNSTRNRHARRNVTLCIRSTRVIWQIREKIRVRQNLPLCRLLWDCIDFKATYPEDKIFSLQGLTTETLDPSLLPNPEKPKKEPRDTYVETARWILYSGYLNYVLPLAGVGWRHKPSPLLPEVLDSRIDDGRRDGFPSWVPDWSATRSRHILSMEEGPQFQASGYRASGPFRAPTPVIVGERKDQIVLTGIRVDEVSILGPSYDPDITSKSFTGAEIDAEKIGVYKKIQALVFGMENLIKEQEFWRFLIGNWADGRRPAAAIYSTYYQLFQRSLEEDPKQTHATEIMPLTYHYFKEGKQINSKDDFLRYWSETDSEEKALFLGPFTEDEFIDAQLPNLIKGRHDSHEVLLGNRKKRIERMVQINEYCSHMARMIDGRMFCITKSGRIGFVPLMAKEGDLVCIFMGTQTPFILRAVKHGTAKDAPANAVELVGESYIHGIMDGELVPPKAPDAEWKKIIVV